MRITVMLRLGSAVLSCLIAVGTLLVAPGAGAALRADDGYGSADVTAAAYDWLGADTPSDTYAITLVKGRSVRSVLHILAPRRSLGPMTAGDASAYFFDHMDGYYSG